MVISLIGWSFILELICQSGCMLVIKAAVEMYYYQRLLHNSDLRGPSIAVRSDVVQHCPFIF